MFIPPDFISDLIERTDLPELISSYVSLKQRGDNWVGLCPFHSEKTPSFSVSASKGFYHCFGCGAHGNPVGFLMQIEGLDYLDAVQRLAAIQGMEVPRQSNEDSKQRTRRKGVDEVLAAAMQYFQQQLRQSEAAKDYLKSRGLTGQTAAQYKIGYAPDEWEGFKKASGLSEAQLIEAGLLREKEKKTYDYFRNRIMFPIIESNGRVCAFGGRALSADDPAKYLNSGDSAHFSKRRVLFGLPQAAQAARQKKRLIICEGYMDVVMLAQSGFAEAVATMGTAATAEQMKKALRLVPNVYLAYDGDEAGQNGAFRAMQGVLPALKDGVGVFFLFLPRGYDPDSYLQAHGSDAFEKLLSEATPLGDYMVEVLKQKTTATGGEGWATNVVREGLSLLQAVDGRNAPAWRNVLMRKLQKRTGLSLSALRKYAERSPVHHKPHATYHMPENSTLYSLLCCLNANPSYAERLPINLPLPGGAQEVEVVGMVLETLRWSMHDESEDGIFDLSSHLEDKGFVELARQLRVTIKERRFSRADNLDAEFDTVIDRLQARHHRLVGSGRHTWLEKLRAQRGDGAEPPS